MVSLSGLLNIHNPPAYEASYINYIISAQVPLCPDHIEFFRTLPNASYSPPLSSQKAGKTHETYRYPDKDLSQPVIRRIGNPSSAAEQSVDSP